MMNLKQLEYAEDSLNNEYDKQIKRFASTLSTGNYFKKERLLIDAQKKKPTIKPARPNKIKRTIVTQKKDSTIKIKQNSKSDSLHTSSHSFNLDSIYNSQKSKVKEDAVKYALTYARAAQNNITNSKKQFNHKAERIRRHQIEWHRKLTLPFACLVFFFIGAPFGAIIRKGGFGTSVVIAILFFILYYIISISGEKFAREGVMSAYIGMWLSSFILMPLGIFLTYKATTDSVILNADTYLLFFKRLFERLSKKS